MRSGGIPALAQSVVLAAEVLGGQGPRSSIVSSRAPTPKWSRPTVRSQHSLSASSRRSQSPLLRWQHPSKEVRSHEKARSRVRGLRSARCWRGSCLCRDRQPFHHDDYDAVHDDDTVYDNHDSEHHHSGASVPAGWVGLVLGFVHVTVDLKPSRATLNRRRPRPFLACVDGCGRELNDDRGPSALRAGYGYTDLGRRATTGDPVPPRSRPGVKSQAHSAWLPGASWGVLIAPDGRAPAVSDVRSAIRSRRLQATGRVVWKVQRCRGQVSETLARIGGALRREAGRRG